VGFAEWVKEQSAQKALKRIGTVEFHHERYPGLAGLDTKEGQGERDQPVGVNCKLAEEYHKNTLIVNSFVGHHSNKAGRY
jgi:hypothetical protein